MPKIFKSFFLLAVVYAAVTVGAASPIDELKNQIESRRQAIEELEKELERNRRELTNAAEESKTLKNQISRLNNDLAKLTNESKITKQKIEMAALNIERTTLEIGETSALVEEQRSSLGALLRNFQESSEDDLVAMLLSEDNFSGFWRQRERLVNLLDQIKTRIEILKNLQNDLTLKKAETETEKRALTGLQGKLEDQQKIIAQNRGIKNDLLVQTKSKEAVYANIIVEQEAKRDTFLQELFEYESQLRVEFDPRRLPPSGKVLVWPLDGIFVTQYFGKTVDARRLYLSGTHNGIDLRAPYGTPVKAALTGLVAGVGDTDAACRGASYGKWALTKHSNGLSSLYAHLSLIKVREGQTVSTGELVGYSGQTGYATGPHLHFTVFAAAGVNIGPLPSRVCPGAIFTIPLAPPEAYLDPINYLNYLQ